MGDKLYGGDERVYLDLVFGRLTDEQRRALLTPHHALHARLVRWVEHARETRFEAEPEEWFRRFAGLQT